MKTIIIFITTILFQQCTGQSGALPECIEKLNLEKNKKYENTLQLPNGETVYKIKITRPQKCMDCTEGTVYKDSLCNIVASFTVGIAPKQYVKEGYEKSWFVQNNRINKEKLYPSEIKHSAEDSLTYSEKYKLPFKFKVITISKQTNPLKLIKNDIIEISLENGLTVYRKSKKHNQYKLIPETKDFIIQPNCIKAPCPSTKKTKNYFRWDDWGISINEDRISVYNFQKFTENKNSDWEHSYEIQKLSE